MSEVLKIIFSMSKVNQALAKEDATLLKSLQNKQRLIQEYFSTLSKLEVDRRALNSKIKKMKERINELIYSDPDPSQLKLFENIDEFLTSIVSTDEDQD